MASSAGQRERTQQARQRANAVASANEERRRRQAAVLAQLDCLHDLADDTLLRLADIAVFRAFFPGVMVLSELTPNRHLYLILRGTVMLKLHDRIGREVLVGVLNRGDCFGEGALFGDQFRNVAVQTETICHVLQIPLHELRSLIGEAPDLAHALRTIYRRRLVESTLGRIPLFSQLSPLERIGIAELLQPAHYVRGELIITQGSPGTALYLVESGQVLVEQHGQLIAQLEDGDFFGEMSLLHDTPHNADIRALTPADVLILPATDFEALLARQPTLAAQLHDVAERRRVSALARQNNQQRVAQLSAAIERGLLRGRHVLVRDPQLCDPNCRQCEQACAARHGQARIRVDGVALESLEITESCRQCKVAPECVEACPEDAIQWNERGALFVTDQCTGCGACVPACPYDAVQLVDHTNRAATPLWGLWRRVRSLSRSFIPLQQANQPQRANKCDLCHGYNDLACVSACPAGALRLMPVEEVFPL
ncbi:MAG TPA: cyclic nucleotide-binding domain-containing protein [Roseiflexaceae bacterium]|nr:cyclic nucleotide-binding domain-containing protein [Roseiflexaceae bacterium]